MEAEASTDSRPLPGFTPRKGEGIFLFGKSKSDPPEAPNMRIDFQFDTAAFDFRCVPCTHHVQALLQSLRAELRIGDAICALLQCMHVWCINWMFSSVRQQCKLL